MCKLTKFYYCIVAHKLYKKNINGTKIITCEFDLKILTFATVNLNLVHLLLLSEIYLFMGGDVAMEGGNRSSVNARLRMLGISSVYAFLFHSLINKSYS